MNVVLQASRTTKWWRMKTLFGLFVALYFAALIFTHQFWITRMEAVHDTQKQKQIQQESVPCNFPTNQQHPSKPPPPRHHLRLDWSNVTVQSPLALKIQQIMTQPCRQPADQLFYGRYTIPYSGIGSCLHVWSQALCHALRQDRVMLTRGVWTWAGKETVDESPLRVYFGPHESASECIRLQRTMNQTVPVQIPPDHQMPFSGLAYRGPCNYSALLEDDNDDHSSHYNVSTSDYRAAAMEWLFQSVNSNVIKAAERQIRFAFPDGLPDPRNLITVHIRWGDKSREMKLQPIARYIEGVESLLEQRRNNNTNDPVHIYVSSEDPKAIEGFVEEADPSWRLHISGPTNPSGSKAATAEVGLEALAALLVSMEANYFVLTLASNWSRLINELRKNVINPRCGNCTAIVDLLYDEL